jgi:glycosyltransferase involved in cell wall biosynthesis
MIAALLVTHNSGDVITDTLTSIEQQTLQPEIRIAIDDNSTDNTSQLLREHGFTVIAATTTSNDTTTRIAQNFVQGVIAAHELGATVVILGDHDDTWHPHRIAHQVAVLAAHPDTAFLASDGAIAQTQTQATTGATTLRSTFPVPAQFNEWNQDQQWRYTTKHSIATGGASAIVPRNLSTLAVPDGWLHDRWWSLRAVREQVIRTDPIIVIDYRISDQQQVGLDTAGQHNSLTRVLSKLTNIPLTLKKMKDISRLRDGN